MGIFNHLNNELYACNCDSKHAMYAYAVGVTKYTPHILHCIANFPVQLIYRFSVPRKLKNERKYIFM